MDLASRVWLTASVVAGPCSNCSMGSPDRLPGSLCMSCLPCTASYTTGMRCGTGGNHTLVAYVVQSVHASLAC